MAVEIRKHSESLDKVKMKRMCPENMDILWSMDLPLLLVLLWSKLGTKENHLLVSIETPSCFFHNHVKCLQFEISLSLQCSKQCSLYCNLHWSFHCRLQCSLQCQQCLYPCFIGIRIPLFRLQSRSELYTTGMWKRSNNGKDIELLRLLSELWQAVWKIHGTEKLDCPSMQLFWAR